LFEQSGEGRWSRRSRLVGALADQGREIRSGGTVGEIGQKLELRAGVNSLRKPGFERAAPDKAGWYSTMATDSAGSWCVCAEGALR
jgi:hypothetical protein